MLKRGLPPVHPGEVLREMFIKENNLTVTEVAKGIGVGRANLSALVNEHTSLSPEMAIKLSKAFGNTAQFWLNLQKNYELWRQTDRKCLHSNSSGTAHFMKKKYIIKNEMARIAWVTFQ